MENGPRNFLLWLACVFAIAVPGISLAQTSPSSGMVHYGRAIALQADIKQGEIRESDTHELGPEGGSSSASRSVGMDFPAWESRSALAFIRGADGTVNAYATIERIRISVAGNAIHADQVNAISDATCDAGTPFASGGAEITNLRVNGQIIPVTGQPGQVVELPNGKLTINEHIHDGSEATAKLTITALRIQIPDAEDLDVRVAKSFAGMTCPQ